MLTLVLCNDFGNAYKTLFQKLGKQKMEVKCLRTLGLEIFKTLNKLNPPLIKVIFHRTKWPTYRPNNTQVKVHKAAKYGEQKLRTLSACLEFTPRAYKSRK